MNYKELDDDELLYMINELDEDSFNSLYQKYLPTAYKCALNKKNTNINIEFEELLAGASDALLTAIKTYDKTRSAIFKTHVYTCIKNQINNLIRSSYAIKRDVNKNYNNNKEDIIIENYVTDPVTPLDIVIDLEFSNNIIKFKNDLDNLTGAIFELRYNEFTMQEIAVLLDISPKRVEGRLNIIKRLLKKYLLNIAKNEIKC